MNNLKYKGNAILAFALGLGLLLGETIRRAGEWGHWSRWMDDYLFGGILIIAAYLTLKNSRFGTRLLIGSWGLCTGLLYGSFFSKFVNQENIHQSNIDPNVLILLIGIAFVVAVIGLVWCLFIAYKSRN